MRTLVSDSEIQSVLTSFRGSAPRLIIGRAKPWQRSGTVSSPPFASGSVVRMVGLADDLLAAFFELGSFSCEKCGGEVAKRLAAGIPPSDDLFILALSQVAPDERRDLQPLFETLGVRYVITGDCSLVAREDLTDLAGVYPVIAIETAVGTRSSTVEEWLTAHGGSLHLFSAVDRNTSVKKIMVVAKDHVCGSCGVTYPNLHPAMLSEKGSWCSFCTGKGVKSLSGDPTEERLCEACHGSGLSGFLQSLSLGGISLSAVPFLRFHDLENFARRWLGLSPAWHAALSRLDQCGLGHLSLDSEVERLSSGELARMEAYALRTIGVRGVTVALWEEDGHLASLFTGADDILVMGRESIAGGGPLQGTKPNRSDLGHATISRGPLQNAVVHFVPSSLNCLAGPESSGKSIVLEEMARLFRKRKKSEALVNFRGVESLRRIAVDSGETKGATVGEITGMTAQVAEYFAQTRESRLKGFSAKDFLPFGGKFRCPVCEGSGGVGQERCESCQGTGLAADAGQVKIGGVSIIEVLSRPLDTYGELAWLPDKLTKFAGLVQQGQLGHWSLVRNVQDLDVATVRFLEVAGQCASVETGQGTLILCDRALHGLLPLQRQVIAGFLTTCAGAGHTILYAERSVPAELHSACEYVVELAGQTL